MLKKVIKYTNFDNEERSGTFYFNLTKAEVIEMELGLTGGVRLSKYIEDITSTNKEDKIIKIFKELVLLAYGEKSPDGEHFVKSKEISEAFSHTEAYSELFMELATNAESAAAFINGIIPQINKN